MKARRYLYIYIFFILLICLGAMPFFVFSQRLDFAKVFPFSTEVALKEWEEKILKGRVIYRIEPENAKDGFVHAISDNACSGMYYKIRFDPKESPYISWKWRVLKFPDKKECTSLKDRKKDDFAARVYVIFPTLFFANSKSLEYVWDEYIPEGAISSSPYSDNIKLFVIQSGKDKINHWIFEERNIYEDYIAAYGSKPRMKVGAIAFMTDADSTSGVAEANYDDIRVGYTK